MIFITGINGLVGSYIARELLSRGEKIRGLHRKNSDLSLIQDIQHQIEWVEGDILDVLALEKAMQGCEYIIHCAAMVSFAPKDRQLMYQVNIEGTRNMVNIASKNSIRKFLFISSIAAIGRQKGIEIVNEENKWVESELNSHYSKTKYLAEIEVWRAQAEGLPMVIINPSLVLGPSDWEKSSTRVFKYVWEEKLFYSRGSMNYVDVRDVAEISAKLLFSDIFNERFIVNAGRTTYEEAFNLIAQNFQKRAPKYPINGLIAEIAWRFFYVTSLISGKAPLITKETARLARNNFFYLNDKVTKQLGFQFKPLTETIAWTCEHLKKRYG
jgi:nucleoside-diphosphate-sugar epimerase